MSILLAVLTVILVLVSVFLVFVVLAQKAKSDGGMGAAMGSGMAEAAFGAETSNVLSKATINASIAFFILSFVLYLGRIYQQKHAGGGGGALPAIPASFSPAPKSSAPVSAVPLNPMPSSAATAPSATPPVPAPAKKP